MAQKEDGMSIINKHIESGEFSKIYLFTGDQRYLIDQYVKKLSSAMTDVSEGSMNYMKLNKDGIKFTEIADFALDMPFFADHKVVEIWNSGFFKKGNESFEGIIPDIPDTTTLIFVENEVDKRIKLVNMVKEVGTLVDLSTPDERTLLIWLKSMFKQEEYNIDDSVCYQLLAAVGTDMNSLMTEVEKLKSYAYEGKTVTGEMVDKLCVNQVEGKVFDMIDALSKGDRRTTIRLYDDLMTLREPPMKILALINRQFDKLLKVRIVMDEGGDKTKMSKFSGLQPFLIERYMAQAKGYSQDDLMKKLYQCQQCEIDIKTGRTRDVRALEMLVLNLLR